MAVAGRLKRSRTLLSTLILGASASLGCGAPVLTADGQFVFTPGGQQGATVITANGVEFVDRADVPRPVPRSSPYEAWRPATGFLLPDSGLWKRVAEPLVMHGEGVEIELAASDRFAPSWGGEIFLRVLVTCPRSHGTTPARRVIVVLDDRAEASIALLRETLFRLRAGDEIALVDTDGSDVVVPPVSAGRRTLIEAAAITRSARIHGPRDVSGSLERAATLVRASDHAATSQVVLITSGRREFGDAAGIRNALDDLAQLSARVTVAASGEGVDRAALALFDRDPKSGGAFATGSEAISSAIAPRAAICARDLTLRIASAPAPTRMIEASGGEVVTTIDEELLLLGDVHEGDAREEVLRLVVPVFVPNEELSLSLDGAWTDPERTHESGAHGTLALRYTDAVTTLGRERNADVLADAAAMGAVHRLGREAFGSGGRFDAFTHVASWAWMSLAEIGRTQNKARLIDDAAALQTLVGATR